MNVKRFTARTSRDALAQVRQAFGDDAVVLSTRPCAEGVEVLAMAPDGMRQIEKMGASAPLAAPRAQPAAPAAGGQPATGQDIRFTRPAPAARRAMAPADAEVGAAALPPEVHDDVERLQMSTLSFQDYVRDRMLKRRRAELDTGEANVPAAAAHAAHAPQPMPQPVAPRLQAAEHELREAMRASREPAAAAMPTPRRAPPVLHSELNLGHDAAEPAEAGPARRERGERDAMMDELRSMKGLIEERFGALAFMEKLQRNPRQATLSQKLLDGGFSPALIRKLVASLPADAADELAWAAGVLEHNLATDEHEPALEEVGGVYALIGSTGVGKTTSTAKIAAAFAAKHGAAHLGLVTLDAYRVAAHEQLRAYGRILGVPVHTAHDRASLEDLLELLSAKKMVLIDTAGMAQRDTRTRELLEMLSHRSIQKLLVVNAAQQGETIEDVMISYRASLARGVILSKIDEAVKLGPALDALIRHKLKVVGVANGQRVPEDWHRLSANALVQRALRGGGSPSWRLDASDINLVFAGVQQGAAGAALHV